VMGEGDEVTRAHYELGEFAVIPRQRFEPDRPPPALLGGRYEVGRLIGSGGTARVYRAYDLRLEREVAVKVYDQDAVALDQRRRLREMGIQGSITHPGVVALHDSGTEQGRTYLVMQLVEGENLAERLLGGPMTAAEVLELATGLTEALAHVHDLRIVHRDLKPANVFLNTGGPLIGDFGIAHALDTTHITGTGVIPGTAAYLAPEQVGGEPAGPSADVYALGLILLECLTGRREYQGTMVEAAMARLSRPPRIPDGLPPALAHTLRRMTRREPGDRPTAAEARGLLHAPPVTLPSAVVPGLVRHRRALLGAGLAAAAAATVAAVLLAGPGTGGGTPAPPAADAPAATTPSAPASGVAGPATETAPGVESASLEPAAVTHDSPPRASATASPPSGKSEKPKAGNPGKGKGSGKGRSSLTDS
jgi:tRNA A-37 threonylcarbamoyl transferase component Bud32